MTSRSERPIREFTGCEESVAIDSAGSVVARDSVIGGRLLFETQHDIQIFFIGIGEDADIQVGRILSEASGAEYQGVAEEDLAELMEEFSKYF